MEVEALKSEGVKPAGDKSAAAQTDSEHTFYQLNYRPEEAKFSSTARVWYLYCSAPIFLHQFVIGPEVLFR